MLVLGCTSKFFQILQILEFLNVARSGLLKRRRIGFFEYKPRLHFHSFRRFFLKSWEIGIFESPLFHILLNCEGSLSGTVCF